MTDKDEILAAIAALGTGLTAKIGANHADLIGTVDTIANGVGRIQADLAKVARDVLQIRVDLAAYRLQTDARITALESRP